jgi:hypothetical protein
MVAELVPIGMKDEEVLNQIFTIYTMTFNREA